jgi:hypothetical protein
MAAAPSLPTALNAGDVVSNAWVDAVRDGLEFHRVTRPVFKSQCSYAGSGTGQTQSDIGTGVDTEMEASDGAGVFNFTADINIGGFTAGTGGEHGVYLPYDGVYVAVGSLEWESNGTGYRQIGLKLEGSYFDDSRNRITAVSGGVTRHQATTVFSAVTGNELTMYGLQNSGGDLEATAFLSIYWLVDS